jgi:signal transduction histidine kinase
LLEALLATGPGSTPARVLLAVGFTAPLVVRRRWPLQALVFIAALAAVRGLIGGPDEEGAMPVPSMLLASFSAALYARPRWLAYAAVPIPLLGVTFGGYGEIEHGPGAFISLVAWLGGWLVRRRAEQLERERAVAPELAREAVAAERARVAAELHDVVAHSVSIVSVQAGAAGQLLEKDPSAAREHLRAVQQAAQEALREMRRLLGVLRDDQSEYAPQPGLARLPELVEEARGAGLPVELREEGERGEVAQGVDLAAFRIVQEALTNVRKHAGRVPTKVGIRYAADEIELEVENAPGTTGNGGGSGHGILGMGERARVYGGSVDAGPDGRGGFAVRARLPR